MRLALPALSLLLACTGGTDTGSLPPDDTAEPRPDPLAWELGEAGPYGVGYRSWDRSYSPGEGFEDRTIRINVWYPTTDESGDAATYTLGTDPLVFEDAAPADPAYSVESLPGWTGEAGYPVHLHSHGSQGYGATSAFLSRHFASHGWVFVAPDHTDNTLIDNVDPRPSEHYLHRPLDVSQALDALDELPADDPLAGLAHTEEVLLSGHSFGVYTTWASSGATFDLHRITERCEAGELGGGTCHPELVDALAAGVADSRVAAALPMAASIGTDWFGETGHRSVGVPVLALTGSNDDVGQVAQWDRIDEIDFSWAELEGGCHQTFALGTCASLDTDLGYRIVSIYALALARREILGDVAVSEVLSGEEEVSDLVSFHRK